jgi:hypothetical protein
MNHAWEVCCSSRGQANTGAKTPARGTSSAGIYQAMSHSSDDVTELARLRRTSRRPWTT